MSAYNGSKRSGSARWHSIADGTLWSSVALYLICTAYTLCKRAHTHTLIASRTGQTSHVLPGVKRAEVFGVFDFEGKFSKVLQF